MSRPSARTIEAHPWTADLAALAWFLHAEGRMAPVAIGRELGLTTQEVCGLLTESFRLRRGRRGTRYVVHVEATGCAQAINTAAALPERRAA
jgi:hypothetical protein